MCIFINVVMRKAEKYHIAALLRILYAQSDFNPMLKAGTAGLTMAAVAVSFRIKCSQRLSVRVSYSVVARPREQSGQISTVQGQV
jgi:hypothetical protein